MRAIAFILPFTIPFLFQSCGNDKTENKKKSMYMAKGHCVGTFEFLPGVKDTVNIVDCDGKKQEHWIITKWVVLNKKSGAVPVWSQEGHYIDGKKEDYWRNYAETGEIKDSVFYKNGVVLK
jgi:antitoxin component YwqK of YwqJK toxin-antitoxin module